MLNISSYQNVSFLRAKHIQTHFCSSQFKMYTSRRFLILTLFPLFYILPASVPPNLRRPRLLPSPLSGSLRGRWQQHQRPVHLHPQLASPFLPALSEASRPRAAVPFRLPRRRLLLLLLLNFLPLHLVVVAEKTAAAVAVRLRHRLWWRRAPTVNPPGGS